MKFENDGKFIKITEVEPNDLLALLKCQVRLGLLVYDIEGNLSNVLYLFDRNGDQTLEIQDKNKRKRIVGYNEAAEMMMQLYSEAEYIESFEILIDKGIYQSKKKVLDAAEFMSETMIQCLVYLDYKPEMYTVKLKDNSGFIVTIFYWPKTNTCYMIQSDGMKYLEPATDLGINSIEDILSLSN